MELSKRLCSVMAGGTARPAAAEGEAGHEPGTGWPGPQVAALGRGARAHGRPSRLGIYGEPPMSRCGPAFPRSFRPSNRRKRWIAHVMAFTKRGKSRLRFSRPGGGVILDGHPVPPREKGLSLPAMCRGQTQVEAGSGARVPLHSFSGEGGTTLRGARGV